MRFALEVPDIRQGLTQAEDEIAHALTATMGEVRTGLVGELREQVVSAGLGPKLAKTWQGKVYPAGQDSLDPSVYVWSKAPKIIDVFDRGATIRSKEGWWLAIPTEAAGKSGSARSGKSARITPGGFERRTGLRLRLIYRGRLGRPSFLVADNAKLGRNGLARSNDGRRRGGGAYTRLEGRTTVIVFILVPQVTIRRRLDTQKVAQQWASRVQGLLESNWR